MPSSLILLYDKPSYYNEIIISIINIIKYVGFIYFLYFFNLAPYDKFLFLIVNLFKRDVIYNLCILFKKISYYKYKNAVQSNFFSNDTKISTYYYFIFILLIESFFLILIAVITFFVFGDKNNIYLLGIIYIISFLIDNISYWFIIKNLFY
jgi:hypothetical protein